MEDSRLMATLSALAADVAALKKDASGPALTFTSLAAPAETKLQKQGNIDQYKFCSEVLQHVQAALSCLPGDDFGDHSAGQSAISSLEAELNRTSDLLVQRQKIIRLADRSEHGWAVVPFYLADPLAGSTNNCY